MGTTIAGNQHIGSNYAKYQYLWKPGSGGDYGTVELYEEDRIFVYQFNPLYDQRDDGVLAVEFYYYYRKPTSEKFYEYCYYAEDFYIYPFLAWYDEDGEDGGAWGGIMTFDSQKISLVGRDTGWIHVTLHVEEYIWGRFTNNGKTFDNTIYIGVYSPILVLNWDTSSANASGGVVPYEIFWNFDEYEDDTVYDLMTGGYLEDCYDGRHQINDYPSFYITYRDVTPESFAYSVNEAAVMNVSSGITKKANFKKLLAEIKAACATDNRKLIAQRTSGIENVTPSDTHFWQTIFKRLFSDSANSISSNNRKHSMYKRLEAFSAAEDLQNNHLLFFRGTFSENLVADSTSKKLCYLRLLSPDPKVESDVVRKQVLFRTADSEIDFTARSFASRLFFRAVQSMAGFWDWLRGKIREANNIVTFFCPIHLEIEMECHI